MGCLFGDGALGWCVDLLNKKSQAEDDLIDGRSCRSDGEGKFDLRMGQRVSRMTQGWSMVMDAARAGVMMKPCG